MERFLKNIFDFQRFIPNAELEKLIIQTEKRYGECISDDELKYVNAAGDMDMEKKKNPGIKEI